MQIASLDLQNVLKLPRRLSKRSEVNFGTSKLKHSQQAKSGGLVNLTLHFLYCKLDQHKR